MKLEVTETTVTVEATKRNPHEDVLKKKQDKTTVITDLDTVAVEVQMKI